MILKGHGTAPPFNPCRELLEAAKCRDLPEVIRHRRDHGPPAGYLL